jgi:hypothetical protein
MEGWRSVIESGPCQRRWQQDFTNRSPVSLLAGVSFVYFFHYTETEPDPFRLHNGPLALPWLLVIQEIKYYTHTR